MRMVGVQSPASVMSGAAVLGADASALRRTLARWAAAGAMRHLADL